MKKILILICLGVLCILSGLSLILSSLILGEKTISPLIIQITGTVGTLFGIGLLVKGRSMKKSLSVVLQESQTVATEIPKKHESLFEKQERLMKEWDNTTTTRDKLKVLKYSADQNTK